MNGSTIPALSIPHKLTRYNITHVWNLTYYARYSIRQQPYTTCTWLGKTTPSLKLPFFVIWTHTITHSVPQTDVSHYYSTWNDILERPTNSPTTYSMTHRLKQQSISLAYDTHNTYEANQLQFKFLTWQGQYYASFLFRFPHHHLQPPVTSVNINKIPSRAATNLSCNFLSRGTQLLTLLTMDTCLPPWTPLMIQFHNHLV